MKRKIGINVTEVLKNVTDGETSIGELIEAEFFSQYSDSLFKDPWFQWIALASRLPGKRTLNAAIHLAFVADYLKVGFDQKGEGAWFPYSAYRGSRDLGIPRSTFRTGLDHLAKGGLIKKHCPAQGGPLEILLLRPPADRVLQKTETGDTSCDPFFENQLPLDIQGEESDAGEEPGGDYE